MPNRVWLDVYDNSTLLRLGEGPVFTVKSASIKRPLDGAGTFRASCTATDARALSLLQVNRIIRIWGEDMAGIRLRGEGIITNWKLTESSDSISLTISGPDILEDLKRKNTLLGRIYNQTTLQDACDSLIVLAPGWSINVDASIANEIIDARFDGTSLFKAFANLCKRYGFHMRPSLDNPRTLQISPFGETTGLRINKTEVINSEALSNPKLLMVQQIQQDRVLESNNYFTALIPLGAGEGTAAISLREAYEANGNGGRAYPIQLVTGPDGRIIYYISTTTYPTVDYTNFLTDPGAAVKVGQYKDISPLSNSLADRRNASETLYAAAVSDLNRSAVVQEFYSATVRNAKQNLLPGDKVRIDYIAQIETPDGLLTYMDVHGDFFILSSDESIGLDGAVVNLELSNLDKFEQDELETIFDTIDQMELRNLKPNVEGGPPSPYVFSRQLFSGIPIKVPLEFTDATLELLRVRLRIKTAPLVTFLKATGGSHKHRMMKRTGSFINPIDGYAGHVFDAARADGTSHAIIMVNAADQDIWTEGFSGDLELNISNPQTDSQTPFNVTFWFAGNDVTNTLFGVPTLAPSGGNLNALADSGALANMLTNAAGGLQQLHELEIRCATGRGQVEVIVEVFSTTQLIKLPN
jgi:hypothetical protein